MNKLKMFSPSSDLIVGAKIKDGSIIDFECHFSRKNGAPIFVYTYPAGMAEELLKINGNEVFVDVKGNEWASSDIEFESAPTL